MGILILGTLKGGVLLIMGLHSPSAHPKLWRFPGWPYWSLHKEILPPCWVSRLYVEGSTRKGKGKGHVLGILNTDEFGASTLKPKPLTSNHAQLGSLKGSQARFFRGCRVYRGRVVSPHTRIKGKGVSLRGKGSDFPSHP